jgi:hypothetical protein
MTSRIYRVALLAAVLLALGASEAQASETWPSPDQVPQGTQPFDERAEYAYAYALRYWGGAPPECPTVDRYLTPQLLAYDGTDLNGIAEVPTYVNGRPWEVRCGILVVEQTDFVTECIDIVHELGHVTGQEHSTDPHNVMYPQPGDGHTYAPGCYLPRAERRFHTAHGPRRPKLRARVETLLAAN